MGWNKDDLQAFLDRWEKAKEEAARDPNKKRELDESLRALGLTPPKGSAARVKEKDDQLQECVRPGRPIVPLRRFDFAGIRSARHSNARKDPLGIS